jgi:hypothetical protein
MIFFRESQMPVWYMIDLSRSYMLVIVSEKGYNSMKQVDDRGEVLRMFNAVMAELNGATPRIYEAVTEDQFFNIYTNVWEVLDANHSTFFHQYFQL